MKQTKILEIKDLSIRYHPSQHLSVNHLSLSVCKGEILSLVGESGSGKSTVLRSILGLLSENGEICQGEILYKNYHLEHLDETLRRKISGKEIAVVFQDAGSFMDPMQKIKRQFHEYLKCHLPLTKDESSRLQEDALRKMQLHDTKRILNSYPFELSGGMRQRVAIAMAMALKPMVLLADEPTSSLDLTIQSQVVQQMVKLCQETHMSLLLVTHNMGVAAFMSDKIGVMKEGRLLEYGTRDEVILSPQHAYTKKLIQAIPKIGEETFAAKRNSNGATRY